MEAQQLDLFPSDGKATAQPKKSKKKPEKPASKPKKPKVKPKTFSLKLIEGEIAYQCLECDDEPTIYDRIKPMASCPVCGVLLEVIDEKIPKFEMEEKKLWL